MRQHHVNQSLRLTTCAVLVAAAVLSVRAQTVTTVLILTFLLMGGYYVRNIPVWISWIRYLSFLYWGYNLLIKSQFK